MQAMCLPTHKHQILIQANTKTEYQNTWNIFSGILILFQVFEFSPRLPPVPHASPWPLFLPLLQEVVSINK